MDTDAPRQRIRTRVLAGHRVELNAPDLPEGTEVMVDIVSLDRGPAERRHVLEIVDALPPSRLTMADWARIERRVQEDRDSWDPGRVVPD